MHRNIELGQDTEEQGRETEVLDVRVQNKFYLSAVPLFFAYSAHLSGRIVKVLNGEGDSVMPNLADFALLPVVVAPLCCMLKDGRRKIVEMVRRPNLIHKQYSWLWYFYLNASVVMFFCSYDQNVSIYENILTPGLPSLILLFYALSLDLEQTKLECGINFIKHPMATLKLWRICSSNSDYSVELSKFINLSNEKLQEMLNAEVEQYLTKESLSDKDVKEFKELESLYRLLDKNREPNSRLYNVEQEGVEQEGRTWAELVEI